MCLLHRLRRLGRRIVGRSIADHMRGELVVDALEMARWQRSSDGTIVHADRGEINMTWVIGHYLCAAGHMGALVHVGSSIDNALFESF